MTGERLVRRLAAVLAADVAGYSRLMGADERGTLEALKAHRREVVDPTIASHRGRIVKTTGDGMLVEFASAVDAVTCALAVQEKMAERNGSFSPKITFRIGINVGDIIIEGDDIFGDGVNVAARVENECEPGGVCLSANAFEQVRGKTGFAFDDLGERSLKNIDRPIRLYVARSAALPTAAGIMRPPENTTLPDKPSIALLPFQNMSGDPEQEYFADGMVEDIITALSRFKSLFVIARNSSFTYKGKTVDIKQVGRALGVRYVLEGSVRKAGGRIRITGQLIEAGTGAHLWADKIDGALADVFELQDEVTLRVVGAIAPSILEAEIARARVKPTGCLDAYDLYLRALSAHYPQSPAAIGEALALLDQAIALDPNYSWAKAFEAYIYCLRISQGWGEREDVERGRLLAREALVASRDDPNTIGFSAHALAWLAHEHDAAIAAMERAIHLNPNSFEIIVRAGWMRVWVADSDGAIDHFSRSIRLNPVDPLLGYALCGLAYAHMLKGENDKALEYARRTTHGMPSWLASWTALAAAAAYVGETEEMNRAKERILQIAPNYSIAGRRATTPSGSRLFSETIERGLRTAGIPEQ